MWQQPLIRVSASAGGRAWRICFLKAGIDDVDAVEEEWEQE